jgi:hypothetical protein
MIDVSIYCVIAFALLGSMFYMLFTVNKQDKILQFTSILNKEQQKVYRNIMEERLNIFLQGFILGIIIAIVYLKTSKNKSQPIYCIFVAIVLGVTYIHYLFMPKSTYMLDHIDNAEQARAWLEIYKEMKFRCHMGMFLGVISLPFIVALIK